METKTDFDILKQSAIPNLSQLDFLRFLPVKSQNAVVLMIF